ncbi:hypothetical protein F5144DRAFT_565346 [Chaetomium tenue]|uniref:Uncharacterized protein n=1 Tax=Chaetomium tenue TaxID=1854479 RepID=A0ACB7PBR2_9PEZI|nr:hypothetical protein F5144DRAFT_565346 [Chaetomium globosum]
MTNGVPGQQPPDPTLDAVTGGLPLDRFPEPFPAPAPDPPVYPKNRRRKSSSTSSRRAEPPDSLLPEPDTCRICRGEGSADEPLFFPCKCSGSIKHVHQDCLMEWLSHSQKKHCELCKTPFRFTKLYDPNMPTALPPHVLVSHTAKYVLRHLLTWTRAVLVANVWLIWLPYIMRTVWAVLFWISDQGLGSRSAVLATPGDGFGVCEVFNGTGVCPSSVLFGDAGLVDKSAAGNASIFSRLPDPIPQSLLGGVGFLRNLTRHVYFNRFVIHVLEGLIITVLVIVCFILIILVRDYVVQQQPERNLRAAWAAVENPQPPPVVLVRPQVQPQEILHHAANEADDAAIEAIEAVQAIETDDTANEADDEEEPALRLPPQRQLVVPLGVPPLPRGQGEAEPVFNMEAAHEYLDVFREARGDPQEIMRIARERGLDDRMDYWVQITASMIARDRENEGFDGLEGGPIFAHPAPNRRLRRRANTDGPPIPNGLNPLAADNFAYERNFPPLPTQEDTPVVEPERAVWPALESPNDANRPPSRAASLQGPPPSETESDVGGLGGAPAPPGTPTLAPAPAPAPAPVRRAPAGIVGRVADFMWGRVDALEEADLAPVNFRGDFAEDDPEDGHGNAPPNPAGQAGEGAEAAAAAGLDAEALEDAEDLEGILELVGMRGLLIGLFQNAIFCACLVTFTIFLAIFIPYNIGRVSIWALANPMQIASILFSLSKLVQDCALLAGGVASSALSEVVHLLSRALMLPSVAEHSMGVSNTSWAMAVGAANRIGGHFVTEWPFYSTSEVRNFSAISHASLFTLKGYVAAGFSGLWGLLDFVFGGHYATKGAAASALAAETFPVVWQYVRALPAAVFTPSSWVLDINLPVAAVATNAELAHWGGADRFWAILMGYVAMFLMAALYLRRGVPFSTSQAGQRWETYLMDWLNQASGVVKVILIISIEMLVFPLYCGMLLNIALLPLFEQTTLKSRLLFTLHYPVTSIFVHWFIGTGYMFHFALFVSMCRKIMRRGVLYFIRDPDDPDFHPVRDVLDRNVTTQLRKILFSAFVYGALVIVCLGGVVWGLSLSLPVLPIHTSSNEPVLEFPIDLLFYNFLMPYAVRLFRPSHWLQAMYRWWFRRCARALRITWFLFGERRIDEEGQLALAPDSPDRNLPAWRQWFLEVDADGRVVARSWHGILDGDTAKRPVVKSEHIAKFNAKKETLVRSKQLTTDGRFVRTPASDQVKIPKGAGVFLAVNEDNTRQDGMWDRPQNDIYSSDQYQLVYLPPDFAIRIFLFILFIWAFAAATGVAITIVPLVFGRWMFRTMIPPHVRANDIYAFSIGIYVLGSAVYALSHVPTIYRIARAHIAATIAADRGHHAFWRTRDAILYAARIVYTYFFILLVAPLIVASLMELYALVPLNELMYGAVLKPDFAKALAAGTAKAATQAHTVRVVQTWTVGLLYLKLATRIVNTWFRGSRVSNAARAVLRRGWLDPDASILTRAFVVPSLAIWLIAVTTPLLVARLAIAKGFADFVMKGPGMVPAHGPPNQALYNACAVLIYRMSFSVVALAIGSCFALWSAVSMCHRWQVRIRDEAYLIGERLHNFGAAHAPRPRNASGGSGVRA